MEANEFNWENGDVTLYLVMEFIEGPTMEHLVSREPPTLDQALETIRLIIEILGRGHGFSIHHRDVKHNNVILKGGSWSEPVLVDFGMAWLGSGEEIDFATSAGQEIGNRFLRLPEHAPKGDHHDARSDLAMAAGLLFYMLSGSVPRLLNDHKGQLPHERSNPGFRHQLISDSRWPRVLRFFHVAFQYTPQFRFQSADEMSGFLSKISEPDGISGEKFKEKVAQLQEIKETQFHREIDAASSAMQGCSLLLSDRLRELWEEAGLTKAAVHPRFIERGECFQLIDRVSLKGHADPSVTFYHNVRFWNGRFVASWNMDGLQPVKTYEGSAADEAGLRQALLASADQIAEKVLGKLLEMLQPPATLERFFEIR